MTTIAFTLDDERAARLSKDAATHGLAPEQWARVIVEERIERSHGFPPDFEQAVSAVLEENAELYRRLA